MSRDASGGTVPAAVRAAERLAAVRATGLLDTEPDEVFDRLAVLAGRLLEAPFAFVTLVDEERSFWKAVAGLDVAGPAERQNPVEESFCQYVIETPRPLLVDDAATHPRTRDNPSIAKMGVAAWAGVPLRGADGEVLGSFCVVDTRPRTWSARDEAVLTTLAAAAGTEIALMTALEQERGAREEADQLARALQDSLLPATAPVIPFVDVAGAYRPAGEGVAVVGDFYDVFLGRDDAWYAVLGDVMGKGVQAARITALARWTARAASARAATPADLLAAVHEALLAHDAEPSLISAVAVRLDLHGRDVQATVSCGGHPPPLLLGDGPPRELPVSGVLLGAGAEPQLENRTVVLRPGHGLLLYTDGVTDARAGGGDRLGLDGLVRHLAQLGPAWTAGDVAGSVLDRVCTVSAGPLVDDAALLVLRN